MFFFVFSSGIINVGRFIVSRLSSRLYYNLEETQATINLLTICRGPEEEPTSHLSLHGDGYVTRLKIEPKVVDGV